MQVPLFRLKCGEHIKVCTLPTTPTALTKFVSGCNSYEWGKVGKKSAAAKLASATDFQIEEQTPYAELWMGTHPKLPSKDVATGRSLLDMVQDNKALMSTEVSKRYDDKLPFLLKVLSINKALSIQAHPNKKLAEQLHAKDPKNYPDDNHKPEMAIAITPFDGLCGFRPLAEIAHFLKTVEPLAKLVGAEAVKNFTTTVSGQETTTENTKAAKNKEALQAVFSTLMSNATSDSEKLKTLSAELVQAAESQAGNFAHGGGPSPNSGQELSDLVLRLNEQFPGDVGLFVFFFLNYVALSPGEAMFLRADDIHAYLSGDIVECMASSDNVVRAGFTPKFKDVNTLTTMLTYNYAPIAEQKMTPTDYMYVKLDQAAYSSGSSCILYDPPIEEFSVIKTDIGGTGKATFEPMSGPSIVLCTAGRGTIRVGPKYESIEEGYVFFLGADAECVIEGVGEERLITFRAFCELEEGKTAGKM